MKSLDNDIIVIILENAGIDTDAAKEAAQSGVDSGKSMIDKTKGTKTKSWAL